MFPHRVSLCLGEAVAAARGMQKGQSVVARARDKVQVMSAIFPMQAARHDTPNSTGSIASRPCKKRKDGAPTHPRFRNGKEKHGSLGRPPQAKSPTSRKGREKWGTQHPAMIESLGDFDRTPALGSIRTSIRSRRFRFPSRIVLIESGSITVRCG